MFGKNKVFVIKDVKTKKCLIGDLKKWELKEVGFDELDSEIRNENTKFKNEISLKELEKINEIFGKDCKLLLK